MYSKSRLAAVWFTTSVVSLLSGAAIGGSATPPAAQTLEQVTELLSQGELVAAQRTLLSLDREALTPGELDRALELMMAADRRLRHANPEDVSLQKAQLALEDGDIREAMRHANAVRRSDNATAEQRREAAETLTNAERSRDELAPVAKKALLQAIIDFNAQRYAEAKAGLGVVYRSGVRLETAQLREIERMRASIAELERSRGSVFDDGVSMSLLQPGRVDRREDAASRNQRNDNAQAPPDDEPAAGEELFDEALRFDAQRVLAEADVAFEAGRFSESLQKYQQVVGPYRGFLEAGEVQRAEQRISEINTLLQLPGSNLEEVVQTRQLRADQVRAEFDELLRLSEEAIGENRTGQARQLAEEARIRLVETRDLFAETEYNQRLDRQQAMVQRINEVERQTVIREQEEESDRLQEDAAREEAEQRRRKQEQINEALRRVRALQMEQKYREALQVVDQILFLDPQNAAGELLKDVLQDTMIYKIWDDTQRAKNLSYAEESLRIQEAMVLPGSILDYPPDWPEISFRRGEPSAFAESAADRRVLAELDSKRIPASFADNTVEDVVDFIATVTNLNVDVDWESLDEIGVSRDDLVSLELQPLPARVVLERVLEKVSPDSFSQAGWAVNDGVLVVASEEALRRNTFVHIYDVRDLLFQIPSFTEFPSLDLDSVLNQRQGGSSGSIFENEEPDPGERLTKDELRDRLVEIIQTNVDFEGWRDNGGDTGNIQELNDNLIITNTAKNHRQISGLLSQLREIRAIQINVESRFLIVSQDFFERIGFDLDIIFNAMNSQFDDALSQQIGLDSMVTDQFSGGRSGLLPSDLIAPFFQDRTVTQRAGQSSDWVITQIPDEDSDDPPVVQLGVSQFTTTRPESLSMVPANQNSFGIVENLISSPFASSILALNPALGLTATYLDDIQVDFLVEATTADRRSVVLNAPRLTFTNGNAANIFVVTQQAFVSDLNPVVGTNSVAFDPDVDVVSTGFTLGVEGVVSSDRRYVTMTVQTQLAEVIEFADAEVTAQTGGGTFQGAPSIAVASSFQLPVVQVTSVSTGATVPDRGTLLLGGQRLTTEVEVESGVPVLSKLPIINRFFTNRIESKEEQTLLILIKPTIIIQNEEEEKNFPGLLDSMQNRFDAGF